MTWLLHVLGVDNASGRWYAFWSGIVGDASIIGGVILGLRTLVRHHAQRLAQAAQQHRERLAQDSKHHFELMQLHRRHHEQAEAAADARHEALAAAVKGEGD